MAHGLHIRQDGGAGGGEAGDGLEHGVDIPGDLPGQDKGDRAEGRQDDPAKSGADAALFQVDHGIFGLFQGHQGTHDQAHRAHQQVRPALLFPVDQAHEEAGQHQKSLDPKDLAQNVNDHCSVHGLLLMRECPGCR